MAIVELGHAPVKTSGGIGAALIASLRSLGEQVALWNETRLTREVLGRLSDRELADIGLSRADVHSFNLRRAAR